ncbi:MAG: hypothetical protein KDA92_08300, partial [Planctomycetales bacterium]|nr:hypothetical protein [Planctomycetales bacterium]
MSDRKSSRLLNWIKLGRRRKPNSASSKVADELKFESLESRELLALTTDVPSIQGTVFLDSNQDSTLTAGEEQAGVTVQLFLDDGDGVYETNGEDTQFGTDLASDVDGTYSFTGIDGNAGYFVVQP